MFLVVEDEALKIAYERKPADPRIEHALNLESTSRQRAPVGQCRLRARPGGRGRGDRRDR